MPREPKRTVLGRAANAAGQRVKRSRRAIEECAIRGRLWKPRRDRLPDFMCIGAQKAGTGWLHANLAYHPEIYVPARKELHFFNFGWDQFPLRQYMDHFAGAEDLVKGDITPAYSILDEHRIRCISRMCPDLKIVLILRDPVARAWSAAVMEEARWKRRNPEDVPLEDWFENINQYRSRRKGTYTSIIDVWSRIFGEQALYVTFNDWIASTPANTLSDVARFLGVAPNPEGQQWPAVEAVGAKGRPTMPVEVRDQLVEIYRDELYRLAERYPNPCHDWLAEHCEK